MNTDDLSEQYAHLQSMMNMTLENIQSIADEHGDDFSLDEALLHQISLQLFHLSSAIMLQTQVLTKLK